MDLDKFCVCCTVCSKTPPWRHLRCLLLRNRDLKWKFVTSYPIYIDSAGFTTGPVGPGPRAWIPGGPKSWEQKRKKEKKRKEKKIEKKEKKKGAKKKIIKCGSISVRLCYPPPYHVIIENLRGIRFVFTFFVLISSILGSIYEHLKRRGLWKLTEILKI